MVKLRDNGIRTLQTDSNAAILIVDTVVEMLETRDIGIVGVDVNLIIF